LKSDGLSLVPALFLTDSVMLHKLFESL
jgi:hypothetical protein